MVRRGDADEEFSVTLYNDWRSADLAPEERVMLAYVEKLTFHPAATTADDLEALRNVGFTDEQITDIVMLTGYRAMLNRLHDGLGLTLDDHVERSGQAFVDRFPGAAG